MSADKCVELLEQKLPVLNLRKYIVRIMPEGAIVMIKVGRLLPVNQHLSFVHGV